ncbi:MAG TPA: UbiA family prenyltransferase [Polyangiaceae bacterium]|nr:UbiA family prenyltransferase [Polyangiaceae bacterium]
MTVGASVVSARPRPSRLRLYLSLGRVSNLPTVWTNTLAGVALAGGAAAPELLALLALSLSLFYVGGMFLNDAFDREIDGKERPERPIPAGHVTAAEVFGVGFALLAAGLVLSLAVAFATGSALAPVALSGAALGGLVVLYDAWHKENPLSPVVMGLCRGAVYVTAGLATGGALTSALAVGALVLSAYVVGLTFVARQENRKSYRAGGTLALLGSPAVATLARPASGAFDAVFLALFATWAVVAVRPLFVSAEPDVRRSVVRLIAGISLVDGLAAATHGAPSLAIAAVVGLGATLVFQRWVSGT